MTEFMQNYSNTLSEGSWHDHEDNWNWKAWCWIVASNTRYGNASNQIFKKSNFRTEKNVTG